MGDCVKVSEAFDQFSHVYQNVALPGCLMSSKYVVDPAVFKAYSDDLTVTLQKVQSMQANQTFDYDVFSYRCKGNETYATDFKAAEQTIFSAGNALSTWFTSDSDDDK